MNTEDITIKRLVEAAVHYLYSPKSMGNLCSV